MLHMFLVGAIWDKLFQCFFENFATARVRRGHFQKFSKITRVIYPKNPMWSVVNHTKPSNTLD